MSFFDWNCDGKHDWQDDFIEHQIYEETSKGLDDEDDDGGDEDDINYSFSSSNKANTGSVKFFEVLLSVLWIIFILNSCGEIFH